MEVKKMHNQKRVFASVIALMLCVVTLFTGALAYTVQQATQGYPQPPTYKGGTNSSNPYTSFTDPYLVGYRFSCYRTTDPEVVAAKGGTPEEIANAYSMHNAPGKQLGHSINIMLNATDSSGGSRTDYANSYGQTGLKMPHMLTNAEGTDFYNKISLAQTEMATDKTLGDKKLTHSAATGLALFDYSGSYNGVLDNISESSSFNFYEPLFSNVDKATNNVDQKVLNSKLAGAKDRTPVTIYSGYRTYSRWLDSYLNSSPKKAEEAKNLYTYIYGFQYSQPMSTTSHAGKDMSPKYLTISDIDYEGSDVAPFNHNPSNIINSGNPNSWVNKNHTLIATLCGLKVRYNEYGPDLTTEEFGVYDYIIVEPIYMYYYQNTRYYTTVSDTSILQADSQRDVTGSATDNCWSKVYYEGHELSAICGLFPASFGTALYTETPYFGVDGVYNATTERNYSKNVWTYSPHSLNHDAIKSDAKYTYTNEKGQKVTAKVNPNTHAYVFTNTNGYTMFTGGTKNGANQRVWYARFAEMFIAPQFPIESLLGAGIFMSGPDKTPEIKYEVVYHANPNSGSMNNADVKTQVINEGANRLALYSYDVGISAKDVPIGKIASNYWTFNAGNNGQGIADNAINAITNIYPNGTYQNNGCGMPHKK